MNLLKKIKYLNHTGEKNYENNPKLYIISTCAFCDECIEFLKNHGISFDYVYIDHLDVDIAYVLRKQLAKIFNVINPSFPLIITDKNKCEGFQEDEWSEALEISTF